MSVLAIAVHPDDETLGCGGTLLRHAEAGEALHWLIVTAATPPEFTAEEIEQQAAQVERVRLAYPFQSLHWLKLPTTRLEVVPLNQIITAVRAVVEEIRPDTVFIPNRADVQSDHRIVARSVFSVLKGYQLRSLGVRRVLACEVLSETEAAPSFPENIFLPNVYVDIGWTLQRKIEIMSMYASEVQPAPLPREASALTALARLRGTAIGTEYAESFMLVRECQW